jgi:hypothetical protein
MRLLHCTAMYVKRAVRIWHLGLGSLIEATGSVTPSFDSIARPAIALSGHFTRGGCPILICAMSCSKESRSGYGPSSVHQRTRELPKVRRVRVFVYSLRAPPPNGTCVGCVLRKRGTGTLRETTITENSWSMVLPFLPSISILNGTRDGA